MIREATATIYFSALQHNVAVVRQHAPRSKIMAMVKANAYGHGLKSIVSYLEHHVDAFGVCCLDEAMQLREHGIRQRIVLVEGVNHAEELLLAHQHHLEMVVHHAYQVELLEKTPLKTPIRVWMKINTGMNRLGFPLKDVASMFQRLRTLSNVSRDICLMTHFANANLGTAGIEEPFQKFIAATEKLSGEKTLANSAAILTAPQTHADWVRPGIMLYGISPFNDQKADAFHLKPVMTFHSQIIAIQHLQSGDRVGYGSTWTCSHPTRIGVVAVGYGDGYPYTIKKETPTRIHGKIAPIVGAVSMDMITVDLNTIPEAQIGDRVILWGEGLPIETIAASANTIAYELPCQLTSRVGFEYL